MFGNEKLEIKTQQDKCFYFNLRKTIKKLKEIEILLERYKFLSTYSEPIREIKEGIIGEENKQTRENQTNAYRYILTKPEINEENLHVLYDILSTRQLDENSELEDKKSYRKNGVVIFDSYQPDVLGSFTSFDKGIEPSKVQDYMNELFNFIDTKDLDPFIKSQIAHFIFVYIHPFYDVNGRTARSLSEWYLINSNSNPYTIINRGISFNKGKYLLGIKKSRKGDITPFIDNSLDIVKEELLIQIQVHKLRIKYKLNREECETLELLLKLKNKSIEELKSTFFYQKGIHDRKIISNKLLQLLEKHVISINRDTKEITIFDIKEKKKIYRR